MSNDCPVYGHEHESNRKSTIIKQLRTALAPFAEASQHMTAGKACNPEELGIWHDNTSGCRVTVADFRRAAEVTNPEEK